MCFHLLVIYGHIKIFGNLSCLLTCMPCTWTLSLHFTASCNMENFIIFMLKIWKDLYFWLLSLCIPYLSYIICSVGKLTRFLILEIVHFNSCIIIHITLDGDSATSSRCTFSNCSTQSLYNHHYHDEQSLYSIYHLNSPLTPNFILKFQIDLTVNSSDNIPCFAI